MVRSKLKRIKDSVRKKCKLCEGSGCSECAPKLSRIDKYASANIPVGYWSGPWASYTGDENFKKTIADRITNVERVYDEGESFLFVGGHGTGKTYASCCILKKALTFGFSSRYLEMASLINQMLSKEIDTHALLEDLVSVDFLVIDEFDPRWIYPSENVERMFGSSLEYVLRSRFQNELPTILSTNMVDVDNILVGKAAKAFKSLKGQYLNVIYVAGKDYRQGGSNNG